jgi:hypothetical protein
MAVSEDERSELHYTDETREVEDFGVGVAAVENTGEIEKLCALVYFCPKALFEGFLGIF